MYDTRVLWTWRSSKTFLKQYLTFVIGVYSDEMLSASAETEFPIMKFREGGYGVSDGTLGLQKASLILARTCLPIGFGAAYLESYFQSKVFNVFGRWVIGQRLNNVCQDSLQGHTIHNSDTNAYSAWRGSSAVDTEL
jgi:hypothetical protein